MGGSSSKTVLSDVAWNMKEAPGKGLLLSLPDSATSIKVICPVQGEKSRSFTVRSKKGFVSIMDIMNGIHKIHKNQESDHIFFQGLEYTGSVKDTAIFTVNTGS
jgi:hypothetical protein